MVFSTLDRLTNFPSSFVWTPRTTTGFMDARSAIGSTHAAVTEQHKDATKILLGDGVEESSPDR